ncbi:uncharacterized protein [Macrobrachium rosenbergii]|uniref:uncharacterized protein n=1 Tax=Macrobrachium rosenbergii TaxID=79674 RepID=UPI0034D4DDBA
MVGTKCSSNEKTWKGDAGRDIWDRMGGKGDLVVGGRHWESIKDKKEAKKRWEESQSVEEDRDWFREKNKVVKKVVAQATAKSYDDVYNELGTKEGLNKMIKLSKARIRAPKILHISNK